MKRSFYINISLLVVAVNAILIIAVFTVVYFNIRSIHFDSFQKRTVAVSNFVVAQIDGAKIEEYARDFNKDSYYYELNSMMYKLKETFQIDYLYILVDIGDPETYSYIYYAIVDEKTTIFDDSQYGKTANKSDFPGSERVLRTGLAFSEAAFSDTEEYGREFFAYAPVVNSKGDAVAFLGVSIDAEPMFDSINNITFFLTIFGILSFAIIFLIIMFYCKRFISKPMIKLSADAAIFSEGELGIEIADKLMTRKDELGLIYRSFSSVVSTIGSLMRDLHHTADNVIKGHIDSSGDYGNIYKGSYASIADSIDLLMENTRKIFNLMPVYFSIYDYDLNFLYQNTPVNMNIGNAAEIVIESLKDVFIKFINSDDESSAGDFSIPQHRSEGSRPDAEEPRPDAEKSQPDAGVRHFHFFLIKNNPRDDVKNICCVLTDVSDYVEMSEKALASSVAKSEFLSNMSHEIRTPMNAIIGITEIAKRHTEDENILQNLEQIQASSSHLLTIINDILDVSKIESGKMVLSYEVFKFDKVLGDISIIADKLASDKGVRFTIERNDPLDSPMTFMGDEVRIKQVLINLISNAIKFSPRDTEVRLITNLANGGEQDTTTIAFAVRDNGIGIAPDKLSAIFETFEQVSTQITRNYGGTGLGLPISNALVKMMGGEKIFVASELGKGSEFSFSLDLENAVSTDADTGGPDNAIDFSGKRLLLVDDIEINREIVVSLLDDIGIEIECADDGTVAVEMFSASPEGYYDLIFMDIQMKVMDGYEATRIIRSLDRWDASSIAIIAMSANAFQDDITAGLAAGMNDYVTKPIDYNVVIRKMSMYLSGGEQHE